MLKQFLTDSFATIYAAKYCILIALIIYVCASVTGWLYPEQFPFLKGLSKELVEGFIDTNSVTFISKLLVRNLIAAYITTCIISLWGFFPASAAISNGLLLGWAIAYASVASHPKIAIMLIPHGIFEWPAAIIGWGVGMWKGLGYRFSSMKFSYKERFIKANVVYFTVIVPMLFVAAIIEGRFHIYREFFVKIH